MNAIRDRAHQPMSESEVYIVTVAPILKGNAFSAARKLANTFVNAARHGRGKIQAAASGIIAHGKSQQVVRAKRLRHPLVNLLGRAAGFIAKQQIITSLHWRLPMGARGVRCVQPHILWLLALHKGAPTFVLTQVEQMPVIQARAAHGLFIHVKGDGAHHMQPATRDHGGSPRIARVVGNLRMN